jgi:hypothetical protein
MCSQTAIHLIADKMLVLSGDRTLKNTGIKSLGVITILALTTLLTHTLVLAQDGPVARITLPLRGQTLSGNMTIQGTAISPSFARYTVSYALEPDLSTWTDINGAAQPQANGMLAVWNTRPVPDGKYAIRLLVVNSDGSTTETMVREITLANAQTASGSETGVAVTDTTGVTDTTSITGTSSIAGIDISNLNVSLNLSDIPGPFMKGVKYALYAFAALGAYLLLKKVIGLLIQKTLHKPIDFGQ